MNYNFAKNKQSLTNLAIQILFIFLLLQQAIISYIPNKTISNFFSYLDEISSILLFLVFLYRYFTGYKLIKQDFYIALFSLIITILGLLSTFINHIQPYEYAFFDLITCNRFVFIYLGIRALLSNKMKENFLYDNFNGIAKFFAVLFFVLMIHDYLFSPFFPKNDFRYFTYSTQLFYPHSTYLANACIILMCVLIANYNKNKKNMIYICLLASVVVMTLRSKAICFVIAFFMVIIFYTFFRNKSKIILFIGLFVSAIFVGWSQIQFYFITITDSARAILMRDCIKIANQYFPLGSGFGTFGSHMANIHYSKLYWLLGYSDNWGMTPTKGGFLSDTFWPIVIGQFGYIGFILFVGIVICFFILAFKFEKINIYHFISLISILLYMLISSTSESSFYNPFSSQYFLIFAILISLYPIKDEPILLKTKCKSFLYSLRRKKIENTCNRK